MQLRSTKKIGANGKRFDSKANNYKEASNGRQENDRQRTP